MDHVVWSFTGSILATLVAVLALIIGWIVLHLRDGGDHRAEGGERAGDMSETSLRPKEHVHIGDVTTQQLLTMGCGADPKARLYIAIRGVVYDVTKGEDFYGPDGPYGKFAGKDASYALAKMSLKDEDVHGDVSGLSAAERDVLNDWEKKFQEKYPVVGRVI